MLINFKNLPISKLIIVILFPMLIYFNTNLLIVPYTNLTNVNHGHIGCCHIYGFGNNHTLCCHKYIPMTYSQCIGNKVNYLGGNRIWNNTSCNII